MANSDRIDLLLSAQRALLGMVYPAIRAITVGKTERNKLHIICYLDREPLEEDYESLSEVAAEILADIDCNGCIEDCTYSSKPVSELKMLEAWVYARKENQN